MHTLKRIKLNNYHKLLIAAFCLAVIWSATDPASKGNWFLEASPVFIALPAIAYLGFRFKLSDFSYTLIFIYMLLPLIQAHYGVANVPLGFTISDWFDVESRNSFDRLTHLAFGLLFVFPLFELIRQNIGKRNFLGYFLPLSIVMGFAAMYEVIEFVVRLVASESLAFLFIAAQGDFWDTSKDMSLSLIGAAFTLTMTYVLERTGLVRIP